MILQVSQNLYTLGNISSAIYWLPDTKFVIFKVTELFVGKSKFVDMTLKTHPVVQGSTFKQS